MRALVGTPDNPNIVVSRPNDSAAAPPKLGSKERPWILDTDGHIEPRLPSYITVIDEDVRLAPFIPPARAPQPVPVFPNYPTTIGPNTYDKGKKSYAQLRAHARKYVHNRMDVLGPESKNPRTPPYVPRPPRTPTRGERRRTEAAAHRFAARAMAARTPVSVDRSATRIRRRRTPRAETAEEVKGTRALRDLPLQPQDLWAGAQGPPEVATPHAHHQCGICFNLKSHPVSYRCGHSHCYTCIRIWLEQSWLCPTCRAPMTERPFRNFDLEASIAHDHPRHVDTSVVTYSWDGLHFPAPFIVPDSP
ncbi:hypothetical protein C8J57DRAFT_1226281 [Mycena rebaudengoi]|nr:hypothetical protein C8J57DRAFT_1226281 [Mycena rebaudengoi]